MRSLFSALLGIGLAFVLIFIFFWRSDWEGFANALRGVRVDYLLLGFVFVILSFFVRAVRWEYFLEPIKKTSFKARLGAFIEGYTITNLLPGRIGEIARPYFLSRDCAVPFPGALATILLERVFDALTVTSFLGVWFLMHGKKVASDEMRGVLYSWAAIIIAFIFVGVLIMVIALVKKDFSRRCIERIGALLPAKAAEHLNRLTRTFFEGLSAVGEKRLMFKIILTSLALWFSIAAYTYCAQIAVGINLKFSSVLLFIPITALGIALPTPGGIGGYHAAYQIGLVNIYGEPSGLSAAAIILAHGISYFPLTLWGLALLVKRGVSLKDILKKTENKNGNDEAGESA